MTLVKGLASARSRALVFAGVALFAVGFLPLFGGLGYEYAVAAGLLLPATAAIAEALGLSSGEARAPLGMVLHGLVTGVSLCAVALGLGLVHGLRVGVCDLWGGLGYFTLTAGVGTLLGGVWGAVASEVARRRRWRRTIAVLLAVGGPLASALVSVGRFASSPMIFAYDPFVGYFSGTLYDTVVDPGAPLYWYRAGSACSLGFALCLAANLARKESGRIGLSGARDGASRVRLAAALLFLAGSVAITVDGVSLGHYATRKSIIEALGGRRSGPRCDVVYPSSMREDEAALLLKDCEEELAQVEGRMGARGPARVTAFFFRDAGEKKRLMGAADTYIAKPWREEVYLQVASYPHPVLGHELAHVVAGSFGRGPFRIAGGLGGLWPNPGLIEGVAVAASPDEDELTDETWAEAMQVRGTLPPMRDVFSSGFLAASAAKSYTLAGAFVRWLADTYGWDKVRAWYAGATVDASFGKSLDALDGEFRAHLTHVPLPDAAEAYVKSKFERPSLWGRKCPHEVDALEREADGCRDARRLDEARRLYATILDRDPREQRAALSRAAMEARFGDVAKGRELLERMAKDESVPLAVRHKAREALADQDLLDGDTDRAAAAYTALATETPDEDAVRTLEVKALAARDPDARRPVAMLLVGDAVRPADGTFALMLLGAWEARTHSPLAAYLLGKNLGPRGYYADAATFLDVVLAAPPGAVPLRVRREALRQRAISACALGDAKAVAAVRVVLAGPDNPFQGSAGGREDGTKRLLARCATHD